MSMNKASDTPAKTPTPPDWPPPWLAAPGAGTPHPSAPERHAAAPAVTPGSTAFPPPFPLAAPPANLEELIQRAHTARTTAPATSREVAFRPWRRDDGKVFETPFAFDIETTLIVGYAPPEYILGAATDGNRGYFITPTEVQDFLSAHWGQRVIFHNCAFDLAVLDALLKAQGSSMDIYALVDTRKIWDTMILHRVYMLGSEGHTCEGAGQSTLEACAQRYLATTVSKTTRDADGNDVRTSWSRWKNRPVAEIPSVYLDYLRNDVLVTFECWRRLLPLVEGLLDRASEIWGFIDDAWLEHMRARYGPQTHDLQVAAAVALDAIERIGIGVDVKKKDTIAAILTDRLARSRAELANHGYTDGEPGCEERLQALIHEALQIHPEIHIPRTASKDFSTTDAHLDALSDVSEFFGVYKEFRRIRALSKILDQMDGDRIHPHYDLLKTTGRTSSRNPNIQGIPKTSNTGTFGLDLRGCLIPTAGTIFYVADYASLELRTLSQALVTQFRLESNLAAAIKGGVDVHRLVAARMKIARDSGASHSQVDAQKLATVAATVTREERNAAKPANFGLPAGMGLRALKSYAHDQYGLTFTDEQAQGLRDAWLETFPEMHAFRADDDDGLALVKELQITLADYLKAQKKPFGEAAHAYFGWVGGMALKVLRESSPCRKNGTPYSPQELDFFWTRLQPLASSLDQEMATAIRERRPSVELLEAVKNLLRHRGVFTLTGRLRARASYAARRNTIFQGTAADGAKLALYWLWRARFKVVAFIHDEVVVEIPEEADRPTIKKEIDSILTSTMHMICPDIPFAIEGEFRRSWGSP